MTLTPEAAKVDAIKRSEHDEQVALFQMAALHEARIPELRYLFAIPNGGHRHKAVAGKLKAEGVKSGVPDVCLPIRIFEQKTGYHYSALYIEMKVGRNKPTDNQNEWIVGLREMGNRVEICHSADEAWSVILDYLGIDEGSLT
jgi:hypothetical protein